MKKLILIIISALTALTLCACGREETPAEPTPVPTLEFASGSYPVDAESLRIVVTADEMPRMDEFTALKAVDFTGSDCYEAIGEYIASHSGVRVSLRGEFPNGESFSLRSTEAKLAGIAPENIDECMAILRLIPGLETIDLGTAPEEGEDASAALGWDEVGAFQAAFPDKAVRYGFTLFGKQLTTLDEQMVLSHRRMDDEGAAVLAVLPYMTRCTFLDMDSCGVSNTAMAAIRDAYPDIKVVWRVWFGDVYTCRTDVKRLLASSESHYINDATSDGLYYCTDVVWLDIGHSSLYDLSFLYNMPDIEVCIVACAPWSDATPIGSLEKLWDNFEQRRHRRRRTDGTFYRKALQAGAAGFPEQSLRRQRDVYRDRRSNVGNAADRGQFAQQRKVDAGRAVPCDRDGRGRAYRDRARL